MLLRSRQLSGARGTSASTPSVVAQPRRAAAHLNSRLGRCSLLVVRNSNNGKGPESKDPLQRLAQQAERSAHHLIDVLTPKQHGDFADWFLVIMATGVFMWMAASAYRLYVFYYYGGGGPPSSFMGY
ncbi:hypothetical protein HYH03_012083 [Edaphochlamys debaryana]|uniref:Uncharacterized protein n=1 Tax=Edaphochlamys debaryana TaxID=47281 RepID=A0A836BUW8_9CHLO|nr:hypothetical protein HYH03_012083 [Edaphochlamys debaryana]|eukprot:KAG2489447.1 hypothetical protein HYH03_012083 [Edaphochlamys debaryana]